MMGETEVTTQENDKKKSYGNSCGRSRNPAHTQEQSNRRLQNRDVWGVKGGGGDEID